jgi:hypothetical protein
MLPAPGQPQGAGGALPDRGGPGGQPHAVSFPDHGVARHTAQPISDLAGRLALQPQGFQQIGSFVSPFHRFGLSTLRWVATCCGHADLIPPHLVKQGRIG